MNRYIFYSFIAVLFAALTLETTLFPFPFVVLSCLLLYWLDKSEKSLILIFLAGFALDSLKVARIGVTPLFIFAALFLLNLYEKWFELKSVSALLLLVFGALALYALTAGYNLFYIIYGAAVVFLAVLTSQLATRKVVGKI